MRRRISSLLLIAFMIAVGGGVANAQEFRARITGRVHDSSDAVIVGAKVTATNTETGATSTVTSSSEGTYTIPFLMPGKYSITAEAPKFQKYVHSGITLSLGALVTENVLMKVGSTTDSIVVTAEAPLVDATTSSNGQVITTEQIEALPSNGRSPLGFVRHSYGVVPKAKNGVAQVRPFDTDVVSDISLGGMLAGKNEIMIDGVPNMGQSRQATYSPMMDAVQEIKADGFTADASFGDTMGGTVTMTTKGGSNKFHGTASEYNQYYGLAAKPYFSKPTDKLQAWRSNNYGGTIGGPIVKNKLFFFFAYEGFKQSEPKPVTVTVPTAKELAGDFSDLLKIDPVKYQLYNPFTGTVNSSGYVVRTPIEGNLLSNVKDANGNPVPLSKAAVALAKYFPAPNRTGEENGTNNYYDQGITAYNYSSTLGRLDYNKGNNSSFLKVQQSSLVKPGTLDYFHTGGSGTVKHTDMWNVTVDNIHTFSPTLFLDSRFAWSYSGGPESPNGVGTDPTDLNFPSYMTANARVLAIPQIAFSDGSAWIPQLSNKPISSSPFTNVQYFGSLTKVWARHTVKIGPEFRLAHWQIQKQDYADGYFQFKPDWMNAGGAKPTNPLFGGALASFLLGVPDNGKISIMKDSTVSNKYFGFFIQDDWKIRNNLTINLGLRIEHETPAVTSDNAAVIGFDPTAYNQITVAAENAYKANPVLAAYPQLAGYTFSARGGIKYADADHRGAYSLPALYVGPRVGVAWSPEMFQNKLAVRAGFGIFNSTWGVTYRPQDYGFSQTTNLVQPSVRTAPTATLADPFPVASNPIRQLIGSSLGVNTQLGNGVEFYVPDLKQPYSERWNLDLQYQLPKGWVAVIGYTGSHTVHLSQKNDLSKLPIQYLSRSQFRDPAQDYLGKSVANPLYGILTTGSNKDKTIKVRNLVQPYAHYNNGVVETLYNSGWGNSHALNAQLNKRFSSGMQLSAVYSYSRVLATTDPLNAGEQPWYGASTSDYPHHVSVTGIYQLPFGKGKKLLGDANRWVDGVVGGWSLQGIFMYLSGQPITGWKNYTVYLGGPLNWDPTNLKQAFDATQFVNVNMDKTDAGKAFCKAQVPGITVNSCADIFADDTNYRTFPSIFGRADSTHNVDLSFGKSFRIREGVQLQYRLEAFNAFNHPTFAAPSIDPKSTDFGKIVAGATENAQRRIQMGLRLSF